MRKLGGRRGRRDEGAVLVVVAAFSLVAILFMAFVVDIGNQRQNRRQLTTQTDSIALAVAQDWADDRLDSSYSCESNGDVDEVLAVSNNPVGNLSPDYQCAFDSIGRRRGVVTVRDRETVDYQFGGATGVQTGQTGALTRVGIAPEPGGGLRPLALCALETQLALWITQTSAGLDPTQDTITFDKEGMGCGGGSGNWGEVQIPGAGNGQSEWRDAVLNGADGEAGVGDLLPPQTGIGMNSAESAFDELRLTEPIFHLPVYENNPGLPPGGTGNNARYQIVGFLEVELIDFEASGSSADLTIKPLSYDQTGPCCNITPHNADFVICDVGTIGGTQDSSVNAACLPPFTPPIIPDLVPPAPDPACSVVAISKVLPVGAVTLTSGSPKRTQQPAVFNVSFDRDVAECGELAYRLYRQQGANTTDIPMVVGPAPTVGSVAQIQLEFNTPIPQGAGTYAVEVVIAGLPLSPSGSLTITN